MAGGGKVRDREKDSTGKLVRLGKAAGLGGAVRGHAFLGRDPFLEAKTKAPPSASQGGGRSSYDALLSAVMWTEDGRVPVPLALDLRGKGGWGWTGSNRRLDPREG